MIKNIQIQTQKKYYESRHKKVSVRFELKDYQYLQKLSKKYWTTPTAFLRELYFANRDNSKLLTEDTSRELRAFTLLINNIANNINQIARNNNIFATKSKLTSAMQKLNDLEKIVRDFVYIQGKKS